VAEVVVRRIQYQRGVRSSRASTVMTCRRRRVGSGRARLGTLPLEELPKVGPDPGLEAEEP
jgi:hypothetical protein